MADFLNQVFPAIERALLLDLPNVEWKRRSDGEMIQRRPHRGEVIVYAFPQTWRNTTLGFNDVIAGQAFTMAYVTVVVMASTVACVYMGGTFAYCVPVSSDLMHDIATQDMKDVAKAAKHYGRDPRKVYYPEETSAGQQ